MSAHWNKTGLTIQLQFSFTTSWPRISQEAWWRLPEHAFVNVFVLNNAMIFPNHFSREVQIIFSCCSLINKVLSFIYLSLTVALSFRFQLKPHKLWCWLKVIQAMSSGVTKSGHPTLNPIQTTADFLFASSNTKKVPNTLAVKAQSSVPEGLSISFVS